MKSLSIFRDLGFRCLAVAFAIGMCACGSDDEPDDGSVPGLGEVPSLPTPAYEAQSAKYEITSTSSDIASIELTASGDYIIVPRMMSFYSEASYTDRAGMIKSIGRSRAVGYDGQLIHGTFVKISDTEYILEGFGSIVIEGDTSNAFSLQITPVNGETTTVSATRASTMADSPVTDAMCRTWNLDNVGVSFSFNNVLVYNATKPASQWDALMSEAFNAMVSYLVSLGAQVEDFDGYEPLGFYPKNVIFTKAGTYMVEYSNGTLAVSTWHWVDESKGLLHYSWDYNAPDSDEVGVGGDGYISFNGDRLSVREVNTESEDGLTMTSISTFDCSVAIR